MIRQGLQQGGYEMKFKMMYSFLNSDLDIIEKELEEAVHADSALLQGFTSFIASRGKRIRPVFVLLQQNLENMILKS